MASIYGIQNLGRFNRRTEWRFSERSLLVILYISLFIINTKCQTIVKDDFSQKHTTKRALNVDTNLNKHCHSCHTNSSSNNDTSNTESDTEKMYEDFVVSLSRYANKTQDQLKNELENLLDNTLNKERYEILDGIEIKTIRKETKLEDRSDSEGRALFSKYTYEYRLFQKIKEFFDTHVLSINLPKAANLIGFRSFGVGLKKFFFPLLIGAQVFKSILLAMFLPSILGSFGKILGKGISQLSASSSQASYPPMNGEEQIGYNTDNKDVMGYETSPTGMYVYPDGMYANMGDNNDVNDLSNVDMSRFGAGGQKVSYLPSKNSYYHNQMASNNNYKVFQKIPASSMILSNYDPFYSPLLSRLDGIFARLGLAQADTPTDPQTGQQGQIGGQTLSEVKLEACREQLICLMYSSPAKYAPYSNLVSAQLSRELNELRRPVSDNPEILRFFRYMRAARRGQEGADCMRVHPGCSTNAAPAHTMIAAYHDINKLVTARKFQKK